MVFPLFLLCLNYHWLSSLHCCRHSKLISRCRLRYSILMCSSVLSFLVSNNVPFGRITNSHDCFNLSICLFLLPCVYLVVCVFLNCVCLSVCLSGCLSVCLSVYLSVCLSVYLSVCLTICLSVCLSICLSV